MRNCSLRIQKQASNEVFKSLPAALCQLRGWTAPVVRAPEVLPASAPAIPRAEVIRRARVRAQESPAADCLAVPPAAGRLEGPGSLGVFQEVRSACCDNGADAAMFLVEILWNRHSGAWHTASMLWPSGSSTKAP
jgi:hypothetical protein